MYRPHTGKASEVRSGISEGDGWGGGQYNNVFFFFKLNLLSGQDDVHGW